ncbi:MAG TPA: hypothetical protein ENN19_19360 [Chloroflexi bacterium]|nr:hypothetical protein [Chloroflexota bacterium]
MRNIVFLLLSSLVVLFVGCSSYNHPRRINHSEWSSQVRQVPFSKWSNIVHRGLGVGFVRPEDRETNPYRRPPTDQFQIQPGDAFTTLLILNTGYDEAYPVLVSVFLDYRQVSFSLDGHQGFLHRLDIPPGVTMEIPFQVSIEKAGWHDLFVVAFREPENRPTDPQDRLPPSLGVGGRRTVVCAGDCTRPNSLLPDRFVGEDVSAHRTDINAFPLLPEDGRSPKQRLLLVANAKPGEDFSLILWARNPDNQSRDYVVLPMLNFYQVSFAGSEVLHLHMPAGSELFIPGQIRLPDEEGVHELQFLIVFEPYHPLDEVRDPFVVSDMRSALVVEPGE